MEEKKISEKYILKDKVDENFYLQSTEQVAVQLLNKILVKCEKDGTILAGKIVETEAYLGKDDAASHSFVGVTERNRPMFEKGGILYVYRSYGIHHCINIVTEEKTIGAAVLIRAVEPLDGLELMKRRRGTDNIHKLCNGPGNTAKAFGFTKEDNFQSLLSENLFIANNRILPKSKIIKTQRVGISRSKELMLRFYIKNSKFISRK